jgi:hypothetical protein
MRYRPISVWLSATLNVAESHKINTQSACSRQLSMISCSLLLLMSIALVSQGNEACKRYANLFGAEPGYVLGTNRRRITREQEGRPVYLQRRFLVEADCGRWGGPVLVDGSVA